MKGRPFILVAAVVASSATAAPDFSRDIAPLFERHCLDCHGPEKQSGGTRYDRREDAFSPGDSGDPAIVPGKPDESELLRRVLSSHKDERMPPKGDRLTEGETAMIREWIASGADWPDATTPPPREASAGSDHWSFQPVKEPPLPESKDPLWRPHPIDRFIAARRDAAGLAPVTPADPGALLRRLAYDLTGLPPAAEEVAQFVAEASTPEGFEGAYQRAVDRYLASSAYGERWARHWLDWARYADTAGDNSDFPIPEAYLYRNYVIDALNDDVPYDRFLTEQLAGDLLPAEDLEERNRQTIATGYLAMARRFGSLVERYPQHLTIEDTIDNLGRTVLGLTISCARCHDHKFDPISTRDYYGLYGFFASTRYPFPGIELFQTQRDFVPLVEEAKVKETWGPFEAETTRLTADLEKLLAESETMAREHAEKESDWSLDEQRRRRDELDALLMKARKAGERLAGHLKKRPPLPVAYAVQDAKPVNAHIQVRGEPDRPGAEVPRKFPGILGGATLPEDIARAGSGRLELAKWITDPANPLTARVIVNRVWQRHFGTGLVPGDGDFGLRGERPTHPELLDWLATDFVRNGWSLKQLHRLIVTSRTYRLSSADQAENLATDPDNHTYWRFDRQRLDAESLRDTLLLLGGSLDLSPQTEPYPLPPAKDWKYTQHHPFKDEYPSKKRSVYQMTKRLTADPYPQTFDGPDPNACTATRDRSVTSLQALYFFNDALIHESAAGFAKSLRSFATDDRQRIERAFLAAVARKPTEEESGLLVAHLTATRSEGGTEDEAWTSVARSLFRLSEFLYLD
ncbi:MAG: PSD1 domain-containing protein [Verrucomicrobiales bacterium]|nr:PSD1 domain-containing protein [Verrucomicrobiales bacterium]